MRSRRILNTGGMKKGLFSFLIVAMVFTVFGLFTLEAIRDNSVCGAFMLLMLIPFLYLFILILRKFPYAIDLGGKELVIRYPLKKDTYSYDDIVQVEYDKKRRLLHLNTQLKRNEIGFVEPGKNVDIEALIKERVPDRNKGSAKPEIMSAEKYIKTITGILERKGVTSEKKILEEIEFLMIHELRGRDLLDRYSEFFYIKEVDKTLKKKDLMEICRITRAHTNSKFRYPWYLRMTQAYTVPILVSEEGFSEEVKNYVTDNRIGKKGGDSVYPVLIDLADCKLITLENYQIKPENQFDNIPTKNHVNGLRNLLSIKDHVIPFQYRFTKHEKKRKKKSEPKSAKRERFTIEGRFSYIPNRWTQPTVLLFVIILPTLSFLFALVLFIFDGLDGAIYELGSLIFGFICIAIMWKDLTRNESISVDDKSISHRDNKKQTRMPYGKIRSVTYFRKGEKMGVGVVSADEKLILSQDYYRKEDKERLLKYLRGIEEEFGFEVFNAGNANNLIYHLKRRFSN